MEHIVGAELLEDALHAILLADARNHRLALDVGPLTGHHQANVVFGGFGLVDEHHGRGLIDSCLTNHLRADGASRTGDEYLLARQFTAHSIHVDLNFIARQ